MNLYAYTLGQVQFGYVLFHPEKEAEPHNTVVAQKHVPKMKPGHMETHLRAPVPIFSHSQAICFPFFFPFVSASL